MSSTDTDKHYPLIFETHACRGAEQSRGDASNIIPFPGVPALRQRAEKTKPRTASALLRQALRKLREAVPRLTLSPNQGAVQRKPGSGTTSAAHTHEYAQPATQAQGGRQARKRICA